MTTTLVVFEVVALLVTIAALLGIIGVLIHWNRWLTAENRRMDREGRS